MIQENENILNNQDNNKSKDSIIENISKIEDNDKNIKNEKYKYNAEIINVPKNFTNSEINFKIIVIGNSGVGKTCITNKGVKNIFSNKYQPTIGMEINLLYVKLDNRIIKLQIWDTCGQEIYRSLITNFYRSSSLAIIVYSIIERESFADLDLWIKELKINNSPDTKLILVGNKLDLEERREIKYEEGKKFAEDYGFIDFFETSALTGEEVKKMFIKAAIVLYEQYLNFKDTESSSSFITFRPDNFSNPLSTNKLKRKKRKNCC